MKKQILHFLTSGQIGGKERSLFQLLDAFRNDKEYQCSLATAYGGGYYLEKLNELGIEIIELGIGHRLHVRVNREILRRLADFDVHHFHDPGPNEILTSLLAGRRIKRVLTRRGAFHNYYSDYGIKMGVKYSIIKLLVRRYFDGLSANSRAAVSFAANFFGVPEGKIHLLYNCVDFNLLVPTMNYVEARRNHGIEDDEFLIGTASHLWKCKRVELILHAFSQCAVGRKRLLILGRGEERRSLEGLAKDLKITDRVIFAGQVSEMSNCYRTMDAFVLASNRAESFGNAIPEAMFMEIPCIIMEDSGGLREHIQHGITGFVSRNTSEMARHLDCIWEDRREARRIALSAKAYVQEKYTVSNMIGAYRNFYDEICAGQ